MIFEKHNTYCEAARTFHPCGQKSSRSICACQPIDWEAFSRKIVLNDREPILVEKKPAISVSWQLYNPPPFKGTPEPASEKTPDVAAEAALMYVQGDYFQIDGLKVIAKRYFQASFLEWHKMYSFTTAVEEVYRSTGKHDPGLKDLVVELMMAKLWILWKEHKQAVNKLLETIPAFSHDLCVAMMDRRYYR
ncbi:hypothetical protein D8B26_006825 [Coccidioides posadasii str. Silveira]|uniref:Uncharacterized protein n=1 Tax=Coccidioides posadasii (strain RMSCC 757 / Silveira) TaxID=443226 RepID=E9CRV6_COCPS|nr:conserved hypothetical protein [Coccidioides posadasii str. Silveira]QVM12190.1 hypothetical protein D8B26_006825 [Coccidioides posadasii str. Silveira]